MANIGVKARQTHHSYSQVSIEIANALRDALPQPHLLSEASCSLITGLQACQSKLLPLMC